MRLKHNVSNWGQPKKYNEDQDYKNGGNNDGGAVGYGYSSKLNTCIYGRVYTVYSPIDPTKPIIDGGQIYDLLTGEQIYHTDPLYEPADSASVENMVRGFWETYNSVIQ